MAGRDQQAAGRPVPGPGRHRLHVAVDPMTLRRAGDARTRRTIAQPVGRFRLRAELTAPGAISLDDAQTLVVADWARQVEAQTIGAGVIKLYRADLARFLRYAKRAGVAEVRDITSNLVLTWMHAVNSTGQAPTAASVGRRMAAVRAFFTTCTCLNLHNVNPAYSVSGAAPAIRYVSPLRPEQIAHLKQTAPYKLRETKTPATLALLLCGATSREAAYIRVTDIDLDQRLIWLHDGGDRTRPRWVRITDSWALEALRARIQQLGQKVNDAAALSRACIAYDSRRISDNPVRRQAAVSVQITTLMRKARIYEPGKNRVESIREAVALDIFEKSGGSLPAVATALGMSSLDATAHIVGYDWVTAHSVFPEPKSAPATGSDL